MKRCQWGEEKGSAEIGSTFPPVDIYLLYQNRSYRA
jgi:hypothetical protein